MSTTTDHKTFFGKVFAWIGGAFKTVKDDWDKVAIAITEGVKTALNSPEVGWLATIVDDITHTTIAADLVPALQAGVVKVLAAELALQGLPDNPTQADVDAFEKEVLTAFGGASLFAKTALYTKIAYQVGDILAPYANGTEAVTYANIIASIDQAYKDYQTDVANQASSDAAIGIE